MAKLSGKQPEQKPFSPAANASESGARSRRRPTLYVAVILLVLATASLIAVYVLSQDEGTPPPTTEVNLSATLVATNVPPTEVPQEVALQQQLRDWALTVTGVTNVLTLDVDMPTDEPPLVYAELEVSHGYNNTSIVQQLMAKVDETLNATQYSDFDVIMNDGTQVIEYMFNHDNGSWTQTMLSGSAPED